MAKKRLTLHGIFMNNKFVLAFSILVSVIIWGAVSMTVSPEETRVVENVKVTLEQSEDSGYQAFGFEDTYVDVTVKGKKYLISAGALSAEDITVVAKSNYVDFSGSQTLSITATVNNASDVVITNISQKNVTVYFDTLKTSQVPLEVKIDNDNIVPDGYVHENPIPSYSTVTVSGPASEINKIEKVIAEVEILEEITETTAFNAEISAVTSNGSKARYIEIQDDMENFTVTIPVSKVEEIEISVRYINMPEYYNENMPEVNIYPSKVKVSAAQSVLDEMDSLMIGTIDFKTLKNENNKFTFSLSDIDEVKILDDVTEVQVAVNCYPMDMEKFNVPAENITFLNLGDEYSATLISKSIKNVKIVGPDEEILKLDEETQLFAKVDLSSVKLGTNEYTADIYIQNNDTCWAYGQYTVKVNVTRN